MQGVGGVAARQSGDVGQAAPPAAPCAVDFLHAFVSPLPRLPIVIQRLCVALTQTNWARGVTDLVAAADDGRKRRHRRCCCHRQRAGAISVITLVCPTNCTFKKEKNDGVSTEVVNHLCTVTTVKKNPPLIAILQG